MWKRAVEEGCGRGLWKRASGRTRGVEVSTCMRVTEEQKRGSVAYTSGSEITSRSIACTRSPRACSMASSAPSPHLPTGRSAVVSTCMRTLCGRPRGDVRRGGGAVVSTCMRTRC
jgi:hypothetical protein